MTSLNIDTGSMASSTPIRIGSFHGSTSISNNMQPTGASGSGSVSGGGGGGGGSVGVGSNDSPLLTPATGQLQQSSSVPSSTTSSGHLQLQSQSSLTLGTSNQSLGTSITPPNSAGLKQTSGLASWATDTRDKYDGSPYEKTPSETSKLNRKESYKAQRKNYRLEKKRVASELFNSLQDPAVIVLADWLKVRGTLKSWTKLWCVLKPGLLLLYKSPKTKSSHWVGTILLTSCQVIERPSKKDGFCFKLFHPMDQSIWAPRGPDKETIGAVVQPLPTAYLIFRAPSQAAGKCWMDALELSLRCSALLLRSSNNTTLIPETNLNDNAQITSHETQWSEADYEKHFNEHDLDADSQNEGATAAIMSGNDTDSESDVGEKLIAVDAVETAYIPLPEDEFGASGEQVEELAEENKSLIWILVKQVRPGMDLSKVVLPTFILEPRSFLDKLSDSYYHADIISRAVLEDDPLTRMKMVVKWYLSGFYKKPKGLKKPYNPILGETFRCYWEHPNKTRTYYIAEQVSHHPPVSAFYVTNRQEGFSISCSILAKSKFYGNSTSAVLEGVAVLTLLPRGEVYTMTSPYAHCKGILMGTLSMELGGKINIECENTGYKTELEFKLKPFLGGSDNINGITGKIKLGKETLSTITGYWDSEIRIKDGKSADDVLFTANKEMRDRRLPRYVVPLEAQNFNESEKLWQLVSDAIRADDQEAATREKTVLEETQRNAAKERKVTFTDWIPEYFTQDIITGQWVYKYADLRPWDPRNDVRQYEANYKVITKTKLQAPMVRTASAVSAEALSLRQSILYKPKRQSIKKPIDRDGGQSDTSRSAEEVVHSTIQTKSMQRLAIAIDQVNKSLEEHSQQLQKIQNKIDRLQYAPSITSSRYSSPSINAVKPDSLLTQAIIIAFTGIFIALCLKWLFK